MYSWKVLIGSVLIILFWKLFILQDYISELLALRTKWRDNMFNQQDFSESKFQKGNVEKFLHGQLRLVNVFSKEQLVWARAPRKSVLWEWTPSIGQCARSAAHGFALAVKYFPTANVEWSALESKCGKSALEKVNTCWSFHFFMKRFFLLKSSERQNNNMENDQISKQLLPLYYVHW